MTSGKASSSRALFAGSFGATCIHVAACAAGCEQHATACAAGSMCKRAGSEHCERSVCVCHNLYAMCVPLCRVSGTLGGPCLRTSCCQQCLTDLQPPSFHSTCIGRPA
jgi:hypothetical protein